MIGILGGTFDPVHRGHLAAAQQVRDLAGLTMIWLMPNAEPPHRAAPAASAADRLAMVRLAVEGIGGLAACDLEIQRGGRSYTIETVRALDRLYPGRRFAWLLGSDQAAALRSWREPEGVIAAVDIVIFNRSAVELDVEAAAALGFDRTRTRIVRIASPPIAAHEVRRRVREGHSIDDLVVPAVSAYIQDHRLYR